MNQTRYVLAALLLLTACKVKTTTQTADTTVPGQTSSSVAVEVIPTESLTPSEAEARAAIQAWIERARGFTKADLNAYDPAPDPGHDDLVLATLTDPNFRAEPKLVSDGGRSRWGVQVHKADATADRKTNVAVVVAKRLGKATVGDPAVTEAVNLAAAQKINSGTAPYVDRFFPVTFEKRDGQWVVTNEQILLTGMTQP